MPIPEPGKANYTFCMNYVDIGNVDQLRLTLVSLARYISMKVELLGNGYIHRCVGGKGRRSLLTTVLVKSQIMSALAPFNSVG